MGDNGLALAPELQRLDLLDLDHITGQAQGLVPDQDLARLRRLLEAGGDVDGVAGGKSLLRARDDLAGRDPDPAFDAELGEGVAHLDRRPHCAQRVVLVQDRNSEYGHDRVTDELLDGAAVALDDRLHALEVACEQGTERLRVERLAERRRVCDVAEEHGHDLALLARATIRSRAALGTEPESAGGLVPAHGAGGHARSLGTRWPEQQGVSVGGGRQLDSGAASAHDRARWRAISRPAS